MKNEKKPNETEKTEKETGNRTAEKSEKIVNETPKKEEENKKTRKQENNTTQEENKIAVGRKETESVEKTPEKKKETENIKAQEKTEDIKKAVPKKPKEKKESAHVRITNLPVSTKHTMAICKFIRGKKIETAIKELEQVEKKKRAIPMKGEIPHRKGKIMSGRYPIKASSAMIKVLKSLQGNSTVNGIDEPIITIASATYGARPLKRGGRRKFKRTHLYIIAKETESVENAKKPINEKINTQK